jgi:hypothetical protein
MNTYFYSLINIFVIIFISYYLLNKLNYKEHFQYSTIGITKNDLQNIIGVPLKNLASNISSKSAGLTNNLGNISNNLTDINGKLNFLTGFYKLHDDSATTNDDNNPEKPELTPPEPTQHDTNSDYKDLLHTNKEQYEKALKEGKSPNFVTPEILLKDDKGVPLSRQKYINTEFAQKLSAYMADYNKKKKAYDDYQNKNKNKKKKVSNNEVTRDFYKKTFKINDTEHFNSFEFMEGFKYL